MNKFSECVEELLQTEDPQLFKALEKLFKKKTGSGLSQRGARDFQQALKSVLFPHIQRMLVGMETLLITAREKSYFYLQYHILHNYNSCVCVCVCVCV